MFLGTMSDCLFFTARFFILFSKNTSAKQRFFLPVVVWVIDSLDD